jgi:peptidoglycan/LPS O-acetylase OafA/YrhL
MIKPLTSLRFFFAAFVFLSHLSFLNNSDFYKSTYNEVFSEGFLGVSFFFILSGFILAYTYQEKILNKTVSLKTFYIARFARIYPIHFLLLLVAIPIYLATDYSVMIINALLLQSFFTDESTYFSLNSPSWSISCELFFYLLFPFIITYIIAKPKFFAATVIVFFAVIIFYIFYFLDKEHQKYWLYISPFIRIFDFFIGILLFNLFKRLEKFYHAIKIKSILEFFAILVFIIFFVLHQNFELESRFSFYYWIPMSILILVFALSRYSVDGQGGIFSKIMSNKILIYAGEISFCFYMTHYLVISVGSSLLAKIVPDATTTVKFAFIFISTVIVSIFAFELIEKPFNKKIKQIFS